MGFGQWLGLLALLAALMLLWNLRGVLLVLFAAVVLAVALNLPVRAIQRCYGWRRSWGLLVVLLALSVAVLVGSVVLAPPFVKEFRELIENLPQALNTLLELIDDSYRAVIANIYGDGEDSDLPQSLTELFRTREGVGNALERSLQGLLGLVGNLGGGLLQVVFVLILAVMLAAQPQSYQALAVRLAPSFYRRRLQTVLSQCDSALGNWMTGLLISSVCVAALAGIGLAVLGIKPVVANALLAGLLNVIPNIGPTISTVFPASVALLDSPWRALAVVVLYLIIQNVESYLITPWVMHKQVKLLPGLTLLSQFVFAVLLGPLGLLMALPLVVVAQVLAREMLIHDVMDRWLPVGAAGAATAREEPEG
ncbi:MAG: AI-2E family transporter [Cyanobacteria bacterium MAG CAR2_bin_4]|nr:AI-2E family transporter [Cyanobacteria bacterium MAG CAR2_bin_4]MCY4332762.1 AI-2E family transporter [Cyanobacteria bacterium MAG CAR1_bin_15]